jgi:hypothetical protein
VGSDPRITNSEKTKPRAERLRDGASAPRRKPPRSLKTESVHRLLARPQQGFWYERSSAQE